MAGIPQRIAGDHGKSERRPDLASRFARLAGEGLGGMDGALLLIAQELPIPVYVTNRDGEIIYHNAAAATLWGWTPRRGEARWFASRRLLGRDGVPIAHDRSPMAEASRKGEAARPEELIAERADGSRYIFIPHSMPLRGHDEQVFGMLHVIIDITDRTTSEEDTQRLAAIVESSNDAIISKQLDGTIMSWNGGAERLFGYAPEEIIGESILRLIPEDRQDEEIDIVDRIRRGERIEHFETVRRHKSGRFLDISLTISPIKRGDGTIVGASKIARDITQRRRHEVMLQQQAQRFEILNRVSRTISQDLDLDRIVQAVTDEATVLSGAQFGAFFYNIVDAQGETYLLYALSGASRTAFESFDMPRNTPVFAPTFGGMGVVRSGDIRKDPRYGRNAPNRGMPEGHLPVVSYLAVPVISKSGAVIGGLFFGHEEADRFGPETETLISAIAGQAAVAIDNARLHNAAQIEIGQRKEAEEARELLLHEIKHRVKNTLATIQALASQTLKEAPAWERIAFIGRLHALSEAHDLLTTSDWQETGMEALVRKTLSPFAGTAQERMILNGPDFGLSPNRALLLTMVLHELGTNAVKYGALSREKGIVTVEWTIEESNGCRVARMTWRENGGPAVTPPSRRGFGSKMIASALRGSDGSVRFDYRPEGLRVTMEITL
ncbi:MAG TPA: PAS domain S-box protein [Novosphingobium sp.]